MSLFRLVVLLLLSFPVAAQDWPNKPVKFVSPYPPGGSVDPLARLFGAKLSESLKQQFIVENRTGASGVIGTDYVAKSAPDGYTFVFIFDTHAVHQALQPKLPFDPLKDFAPVMLVGTAPMAISTGAAKPYKSFQDVQLHMNYKCTGECKSGVLLRAKKAGDGGMTGVLVSLAQDDTGYYSVAIDASGNFLWSAKKFVAAVGVRDLVVVETPDALLIVPRDRAQDVGKVVKWLEERKQSRLL